MALHDDLDGDGGGQEEAGEGRGGRGGRMEGGRRLVRKRIHVYYSS